MERNSISRLILAAATLAMMTTSADAEWRYSESQSPMGDGTINFKCTTSTNKVSQKLPYHEVSADLCVRYKPDANKHDWQRYDVILMLLGDGQIVCGDTCHIRVRFDDKKAEEQVVVKPADESSNKVFFDLHWATAYQIDRSKKAAVEITLYRNGTQTLAFDTAGLRLSDLPRGQK